MVREEKVKMVEELKKMVEEYSTIGIIDTEKLPSKQLQEIRKNTREKAVIKIVKKAVFKFALREAKKENMGELEKISPNQVGVVFSNLNAFKLFSILNSMKFATFAKEGDTATEDIKISAGPTSLMAGPAISELSKVGIPVGIEDGKIAVKKDVVAVKKGEKISREMANALRKLNIQPMYVGLNLVGIHENGKVYPREILELVGRFPKELALAHKNALNLSVSICYPTGENIKFLLAKAFNNARATESRIGGVS